MVDGLTPDLALELLRSEVHQERLEYGPNVHEEAWAAAQARKLAWRERRRPIGPFSKEDADRRHIACPCCRALHKKYGPSHFDGLLPVVHEPDLSPLTPEEIGL